MTKDPNDVLVLIVVIGVSTCVWKKKGFIVKGQATF